MVVAPLCNLSIKVKVKVKLIYRAHLKTTFADQSAAQDKAAQNTNINMQKGRDNDLEMTHTEHKCHVITK